MTGSDWEATETLNFGEFDLELPLQLEVSNQVRFLVIRRGTISVSGSHVTEKGVVGDVFVVTQTRAEVSSEDHAVVNVLRVNREYLVDLVFWRYREYFSDRVDATRFFDRHYRRPIQSLDLGTHVVEFMGHLLDELTNLFQSGLLVERFYRVQANLSLLLDLIVPVLAKANGIQAYSEKWATNRRNVATPVLREEARFISEQFHKAPGRRWVMSELAQCVYLSPSQVRRVFQASFGQSPLSYLASVRVERMAVLLRTTQLPISEIAATVGWYDPDFASRQFKRVHGIPPRRYRQLFTEL